MNLISLFKTPIIEFMCREEDYGVIPQPVPAMKAIPQWYKDIPPFTKNGRDSLGGKGMTAKKCLPMLDAMSLGFVIPLAGDINVRTNKDCSIIEASNNPNLGRLMEFHGRDQLGGKSSPMHPATPIKFINRIFIRTAKGYSSLFVPCINSFEKRFTCLSGLVDTDKYFKEVNFPGQWLIPEFDDTVKAGTPLVTVIPIRRADMVKTAPFRKLSKKEMNAVSTIARIQSSRASYYTKELRDKDEH